MSDEIQGSPPSRDYNTAKFKLSLTIFQNQGLRHEKYEEIKVGPLRGTPKKVPKKTMTTELEGEEGGGE